MEAQRARHGVGQMCRVMGMGRSTFYAWRTRVPSRRSVEDVMLTREIRLIHQESDRTYGSPRMWLELRARGHRAGRSRVERLMRRAGLVAKHERKWKPSLRSEPAARVAPNIVERRFEVGVLNAVWAGDITYVWTLQGWLFLAIVLDLGSRRVVGWATSGRVTKELVIEAFRNALEKRLPQTGVVHHSDRGSQYGSNEFQMMLRRHGIVSSMSGRGNCYDNAVVESFFATMKRERVSGRRYATREEARRDLFDYIEVFYNRKRRHSSLGGISPAEFEEQMQTCA
ncbi:MAG: IS3 family transposase [Candidatus Krumholzibacteria bacterium]|nr:IS3 family transposase [Candidatus Krumholzibacteria bacterium]